MIIDLWYESALFEEEPVEFSIKIVSPEEQRSACIIIGVFETRKLSPAAKQLDAAANQHLSKIIRRGDMDGKAGSTLLLHDVPATRCERILLVGLGKEREFHERAYRSAIRSAIKAVNETGAADATLFLSEITFGKHSLSWRVRQAAIVAHETLYRFEQFKSKKDEARPTFAN